MGSGGYLDFVLRLLGNAPGFRFARDVSPIPGHRFAPAPPRRRRPDPFDVPTWSRGRDYWGRPKRVDPVAMRRAGYRSIPRLSVA